MIKTLEEFDDLIEIARERFPVEAKSRFVAGPDCACAVGALALTATSTGPKHTDPEGINPDGGAWVLSAEARSWAVKLFKHQMKDTGKNWMDIIYLNDKEGREMAWARMRDYLAKSL